MKLPVLIIVGVHDIPYMQAAADYMLQKLPQARMASIEDAAHLPNLEHPEEFRQIVASFLREKVPADLEKQLLDLEAQFWKGDADFYQRNLTGDSLMVFAEPVGTLTKDRTVQTIAAGPRWAEVQFREVRVVRLTDDVVIITYKASARREGEDSDYSALASSVYVSRDGSWKLAFHQQTPSGEV